MPDVLSKDAGYLQCRDRRAYAPRAIATLCSPILKVTRWRGCKLITFSQEAKDDARFHLNRLAGTIPAAETAVRALTDVGGISTDSLSVPEWDAQSPTPARCSRRRSFRRSGSPQ